MVFTISLVAVTFLFHFAWENAQCRFFFVHGSYDATMWGMFVATLGDVWLTWLIYGAVSAFRRDLGWGWRLFDRRSLLMMSAVSLGLAVYVEHRALSEGRWAYTEIAPLLPGTSLSIIPLLQLLILTPLSIWLSARIARRF